MSTVASTDGRIPGLLRGRHEASVLISEQVSILFSSLWGYGPCHVCCCVFVLNPRSVQVLQWPFRAQIFTTTYLSWVWWSDTSQGQGLLVGLAQGSQTDLRIQTPSGGSEFSLTWPPATYVTSGTSYICELAFDSPLFFFSQVKYNCRLIVIL